MVITSVLSSALLTENNVGAQTLPGANQAVTSAGTVVAQSAAIAAPTATLPGVRDQDIREIVVQGVRPRRDAVEFKLNAEQARGMPGTAGDPVKIIEDMPGFARSGFGSDQVVLWGAAPQDSRFYVDGVEIPQLFHGSGIRSTVNGDLLQSVSVVPGAYGPDYGRGIGGIVRLETRDLPSDESQAHIDVSTLDGSAFATGQAGHRVRVALAARYGWLGQTLAAVHAPDVGDYFAVPRYGDYQAKLQVSLRDNESLDIALIGSADRFSLETPNVDPARSKDVLTRNGFERLYLRYRRRVLDGSSVDIVPWVGFDRNRHDAHFGATSALLEQRAVRWGLRAEHRSRVGAHSTLSLGIDVAGSQAKLARDGSLTIPAREGDVSVFGQPPGDDTNTDNWRANVVDLAPNASLDLTWGLLTVTPGLRFDCHLLEASRKTPRVGQTPSIGQSALAAELEPRVSARLRLSTRVTLLAAFGSYSQPPAAQDLSAVFGTPSLGPESATHASLGESVDVTPTLAVNVTGFYRSMSHLAVRDPAATPKLANALIQTGIGTSYGTQIVVRQRPWQGYSGWIAYTLSRSLRCDTPDSPWRLFDYDQPHLLTVVGSKVLGKWSIGLRFRFASGAPRTAVVGAFYNEKNGQYEPVFGTHNSIRLPDFWQLDARIDRSFRIGERTHLVAYLEVLNVTNHANGEEYYYSSSYARRGIITGLPMVGVAGVRLEL